MSEPFLLETERLIIRPFTIEDLDPFQRLLVETEYLTPARSVEEAKERLQFNVSLANWGNASCLFGNRAVILKSTDQLIGMCGFLSDLWKPEWLSLFGQLTSTSGSSFASMELELAYYFSSRYRRQGFATEAVRALIFYAFDELGVERVVAMTDKDNERSIQLMKRVGMHVAESPDPDDWRVPGIIENPGKQNLA